MPVEHAKAGSANWMLLRGVIDVSKRMAHTSQKPISCCWAEAVSGMARSHPKPVIHMALSTFKRGAKLRNRRDITGVKGDIVSWQWAVGS